MKWNMGWMHDTLAYMSLDGIYRSWHQNQLTFSIWYAFSENFMLPLSHDEVVHGIPTDDHILVNGDIVSLDTGVLYKGYHIDDCPQ